MKDDFKTYFWKRFWIILIPLYVIAIANESYVVSNPLAEWEDYGSFLYFLGFYLVGFSFITAGILQLLWRSRLRS